MRKRLQAIFDHAAIGIAEVDFHDRFIAVNNKVCEILGYTREELRPKRLPISLRRKILKEATI